MRRLLLAAILAGFASPVMADPPGVFSSSQVTYTLVANTDTTLTTSGNNKFICLMNIDTGLVNLGFGAAAVVGSGFALEGASASGHQGGAQCFETGVPGQIIHGISSAGSRVAVIEGK